MMEIENKSGRLKWIDTSRAIAIFIVIVLHFGTFSKVNSFAHLFHMPIFYLISGYLYKQKGIKSFLTSRVKSLIVPYFVFSIILYCLWSILLGVNRVSINDYFYHLLWMNTDAVPNLYGSIEWFLTSLFFTEIIYAFIDLIIKNHEKLKCVCVLFVVVFGFVLSYYQIRLPLALDTSFVMIIFYYLGNQLMNKRIVEKIAKYPVGGGYCL